MPLLTRFIAKQRYSQIAPYIHGDVLDLGCGYAQLLGEYDHKMNSYTGVELSPQRLDWLKENYPKAIFIQRDLDNEALDLGKKFDCVLMVALIEHLFNQKFVMENVSQVLKPGGIIVITTPTPFGNDVVHRLGVSLRLFYQEAADEHIVIYNYQRFKILARKVGLSLKYHRYFEFYCNQIAVLENPQ